jgi:hypothetical protein
MLYYIFFFTILSDYTILTNQLTLLIYGYRNTFSKVYPAMYIDYVSELAFDDITPEDPDFSLHTR